MYAYEVFPVWPSTTPSLPIGVREPHLLFIYQKACNVVKIGQPSGCFVGSIAQERAVFDAL